MKLDPPPALANQVRSSSASGTSGSLTSDDELNELSDRPLKSDSCTASRARTTKQSGAGGEEEAGENNEAIRGGGEQDTARTTTQSGSGGGGGGRHVAARLALRDISIQNLSALGRWQILHGGKSAELTVSAARRDGAGDPQQLTKTLNIENAQPTYHAACKPEYQPLN